MNMQALAEYIIQTIATSQHVDVGDLHTPHAVTLQKRFARALVNETAAPIGGFHLSNYAVDTVLKHHVLTVAYTWEDFSVDTFERRRAKVQAVMAVNPSAFVLIETGDYIYTIGGSTRTDTYDAHNYLYLLTASAWRVLGKRALNADSVWRANAEIKAGVRNVRGEIVDSFYLS